MDNIVINILRVLNIKYVKSYVRYLCDNHMYKDTLFGISDILSIFNISNVGLLIDKSELYKLDAPFIACIENDFLLVFDISKEKVSYLWEGEKYKMSITEFLDVWTGNILVFEANELSGDRDYVKHILFEVFSYLKKFLLIILSVLFIISLFDISNIKDNPIVLILNIAGFFVSVLLLFKQNKVTTKVGDRICSLLNHHDCNDVLETKGAKILSFSWSEIGFSYFLGNIILLLYNSNTIYFLSILNILALPYTFWSIWYQAKRVQQWCVLCLIVQGILWLIFFVTLLSNSMSNQISDVFNAHTIGYCCLFLLILLAVNQGSIFYTKMRDNKNKLDKIFSLKGEDGVFSMLLAKEKYIDINMNDTLIQFGNRNSKNVLTIMTNPHCAPCARMHIRIMKILPYVKDRMCVQYVFSSFNEDLSESNRILIAAYLQKKDVEEIYNNWFEKGKYNPKNFVEEYGLNTKDQSVLQEFSRHEKWKNKNKLQETPLLLYNGHTIPKQYEVEDLIYLCDEC